MTTINWLLALGFVIIILGFIGMAISMAMLSDKGVITSFVTCCVGAVYLITLLMVVMING